MHENKYSLLNFLLFILYLVLLGSVIFSFRAITSMAIPSVILLALVKNRIERKTFFNHNLKTPFFLFCCLLFLWVVVSLLHTNNTIEGLKQIKGKSVLVAIPFALCGCIYINEITRQKILKFYCLLLFAACAIAVFIASVKYTTNHEASVYFYHSLVSSYSGHAIQFSILVFVALLYLLEALRKVRVLFSRWFHFSLIFFFSLFLLLLSSKLVIVFFIGYILYYLIRALRMKVINRTVIIVFAATFTASCIFIFATNNKISHRFNDVAQTDFHFLEENKFSPGEYFNGLEFRLLQWKFVPQILNDHKAWPLGVSPGDAQGFLNQKYATENMYTGEPGTGKKGFLGYNTHNEFLEALLQTGVVGLCLFLLICFSMVKNALRRKTVELSFITMLVLAYSFTESVLESQYSGFMFLFFPLFFYLETNNTSA